MRSSGGQEFENGTGPCGSSIRISFDVGSDRGSRQETSPRDQSWERTTSKVKWCRLVTARYGHRGVRLGEARNPGPPKRLRRVPNRRPGSTGPHSANRFEILSSDDDEPLVPPTVPGSSRANRDSFQLSSVSLTVPASSGAVFSGTDRIPGHPCS